MKFYNDHFYIKGANNDVKIAINKDKCSLYNFNLLEAHFG
jgi:hypothetical protein